MFSLKDAYEEITTNTILNKVSEIDIWRRYCVNFEEPNKPFLSELYNDRNPDCRIYHNKMNKLIYKDFGDGGKTYDCFSYIQAKYNCTFRESLKIIYNDFKLGNIKCNILPQLVLNNASDTLKMNNKAIIEVIPRSWSLTDYNYWNQYEIPLELLDEYNVIPCEVVYLHTKGKTITFNNTKDNPIYAYRFCFNGEYSYKVYFPLAKNKKNKWLFSGGTEDDIEGFDQLPWFNDKLILTKSLKDCMVYNLCGYSAISLQGEHNKLKQDLVDKLYKRFDKIIVNYDNDEAGYKGTNRLVQQYDFKYFYIDGEKDLSDFVMIYGLEQAKIMINDKLKELT